MKNSAKSIFMAIALAILMLKGFEGKSNTAYLDAVMVATICYGDTNTHLGEKQTDSQCMIRLQNRVEKTNWLVDKYVHVDMSWYERASMISFMYNVGETKFRKSTLLRKLNSGDRVGACHELPKWVYAKGVKLHGLVTRRESEMAYCLRD